MHILKILLIWNHLNDYQNHIIAGKPLQFVKASMMSTLNRRGYDPSGSTADKFKTIPKTSSTTKIYSYKNKNLQQQQHPIIIIIIIIINSQFDSWVSLFWVYKLSPWVYK